MLRFFGRFFWPNSNVDISETVYSIDLKFEVRIVLDHVPFQIEFQVIRINRFRDIDIGSLPGKNPKKNCIYSRARIIRRRELLEGEHYFKVGDPGARTIRGRALIEGEHIWSIRLLYNS